MLSPTLRAAPVFSQKALFGTGVVGGAFSEWVHHYNACFTCQLDDWYMPQDSKTFCNEGQHLFGVWERASMSSPRII